MNTETKALSTKEAPCNGAEATIEPEKARGPLNWYIVLQRVGDKVRVQPDWRGAIEVGDSIKFLSPDGSARIDFEKAESVDDDGHKIMRYPLGTRHKVEDEKFYEVVHSCKGVIQCTIVKDGKEFGYRSEERAANQKEVKDSGG